MNYDAIDISVYETKQKWNVFFSFVFLNNE